MGKNKDKKAMRTSNVFLKMSPYSPQQLILSTDTESSVVGSPRRPDMLTCSSEKSKKKRKKRDLDAQECEIKSSEFQIGQEHEHGKKPIKRRKSRDSETPSNKPAELHLTDMVDGLAAGMSHHEGPKRKKKKKDKLRQTEETVAHDVSESKGERKKEKKKRSTEEVEEMNASLNERMSDERTGHSGKRKKEKKKRSTEQVEEMNASLNERVSDERTGHSGKRKKEKKKRSTEEVEEMNVSLNERMSDDSTGHSGKRKKEKKKRSTEEVEEINVSLNERMSDETTGHSEKKKKKKKEKEHHIQIFESAASSAQSVQENGFNASTETGETQAENMQVKKKKDKKKKYKEKILGSEQLVKGNGSTHLQETKDVNVPKPEESPTKKRKKNEATHTNGGLKTRQTQTNPKTIHPKTEQTECSVNEQVQSGTGFGKEKNTKRGPKEIDRQCLEELKQFLPNIERRVPTDIKKLIHYDLPRFKEFKKMGIPLNSGRFTVAENATLKKNVEDFLALTGIDSGTKLFYTDRYKEKLEIKNLKKNHRFYESIAVGIPRSCHDVYTRGRKIYDGSTCKGIFTKSELHQLRKLQTLHGNNWKKISELTGRSPLSLEKRYSQLTKKVGMWSEKELQRLLRAVRDYIISAVQTRPSNIDSLQVSREILYKGLPWQSISEKVKTRSWSKCREKWLSVLAKKMSSGAVSKQESNESRIKLIKGMYQMQVEDEVGVNWDQLSALFGDVPPSYVQKRWNKLKTCYVPNWQSKCFADIIDFLNEKVLPCFEANVLDHADPDITQLKESQAKSFRFSDIFQDVIDDDDDEDDDD